jgi:hypothetical protein
VEQGLSGSLRNLMNRSMSAHARDDEAEVKRLEREYRECLETLWAVFEGSPFVLPGTKRPGRPAYDAFMVAAAMVGPLSLSDNATAIRERFREATGTAGSFEILVGRGNTVEAIRERVMLAREILER